MINLKNQDITPECEEEDSIFSEDLSGINNIRSTWLGHLGFYGVYFSRPLGPAEMVVLMRYANEGTRESLRPDWLLFTLGKTATRPENLGSRRERFLTIEKRKELRSVRARHYYTEKSWWDIAGQVTSPFFLLIRLAEFITTKRINNTKWWTFAEAPIDLHSFVPEYRRTTPRTSRGKGLTYINFRVAEEHLNPFACERSIYISNRFSLLSRVSSDSMSSLGAW